MKISYTVRLLSDWHCSTGINAGAKADILVIKDDDGLPYIPGKTIKGLLRDALMDILEVQANAISADVVDHLFGKEVIVNKKDQESIDRYVFFSDAVLKKQEREEVIGHQLSSRLYREIASTSIEKKTGLALPKSLRSMEVCIPLTLSGFIESEGMIDTDIWEKAFRWTRHLGMNRNRGLGRCKFSKIESPAY